MANNPERLLQLTELELAYSRGSSKERRKYFTLIEEGGTTRRGGLGETSRVRTMTGERLACKKLLLPERDAFGSRGAYDEEVEHRGRAFREEYDTLCRLSSFRGFVKARAYGRLGEVPLILMEWVEGVSAGNAAKQLKRSPKAPGADPLAVAQIGRDVFGLLARLEAETELFVHRDLSASNIMIRTAQRSLGEQAADGHFDVCFIDFGSAATLRASDGAFTVDTRILRGATPGYAPPEMLSNDLPRLEELRRSTKIDVYAACSVLYEMVCGHLPFDVVGRTGTGSDYLYKMMNDPAPSGFAPGTVEQLLVDTVEYGICATQDARCNSYAMYVMLEHYVDHYDDNVRRAATGRPLAAMNPRDVERSERGSRRLDRLDRLVATTTRSGTQGFRSGAMRFDDVETADLRRGSSRVDYDETVALPPENAGSAPTRTRGVLSTPETQQRATRTSDPVVQQQGRQPGQVQNGGFQAVSPQQSNTPGVSGYVGPVQQTGETVPVPKLVQMGGSMVHTPPPNMSGRTNMGGGATPPPDASGRRITNDVVPPQPQTQSNESHIASIVIGVAVGILAAVIIWFLIITPNLL